MLLGRRVHLQGLVQASHLNGQEGIVEEAGAERGTVRLDSGCTISAKLENITLQNRYSGLSSSSAVQPAGASTSGAGQPAAATNGLGVSSSSLATMPAADARAVSLPPMIWGDANPASF